jgi:hypothetical protein
MSGNRVTVSHLLRKQLNLLEFPLRGQVIIIDNRTSCEGAPGPCKTAVDFVLELVQYETLCPDNLLRFTPSDHATIEWTAPVVRKLSGLSEALSGSHSPGASMGLGKTFVQYALSMHPSQLPAAYITCNFTVRIDFAATAILFIKKL